MRRCKTPIRIVYRGFQFKGGVRTAFFKQKIRSRLGAEEWVRQRVKGYTVPPVSEGIH